MSSFVSYQYCISEHYDFTFKVFLPGYDSVISSDRNLTFDAKLVIHLVTEVPLTVITVNSRELEFKLAKCKFVTETGESIRITKLSTDEDLEKTEFHLEKAAPAGRYNITVCSFLFVTVYFRLSLMERLVISWSVSIEQPTTTATEYKGQESLVAYCDSVQKKTSNFRIAAVTKFEPFYARKLVPCFDEPIYKGNLSLYTVQYRYFSELECDCDSSKRNNSHLE